MKKRRYRDFAGNDRGTSGRNRRPYSGRVWGSGQAENLARQEYYQDGDTDRQPLRPSQTHLSGGLRQCESAGSKFQWNNLLARDQNPGSNPRNSPGLIRPDFDCSDRSDSYRVDYGGTVDRSNQYGRFDHRGGFTSTLPESHLGRREVEEDHRTIQYAAALQDEPKFSSETGYGLKEGFRGVRDGYDRSNAMAECPIGHGGYGSGHMTRQNESVDYGGSSIAVSQGFRGVFDEFNQMGYAGYSRGQIGMHNKLLGNAACVSSEAFNDGLCSATTEGPLGYSQGFTARYNELVDNAGGSEAFNEGFRGRMTEGPAGYSHGHTPRRGGSPIAYGGSQITLNEGFRGGLDEFNRSRDMGHGGYSQAQTARLDELVDNVDGSLEALKESSRSRMPVGHAGFSQGHTPRHYNGGSPIALSEGFRASDEFNKSRAMAEGPIGRGQTPTVNDLVYPRWAQQSPNEEMSRDYKVPGMKRNENNDMDALFLLDLLYKKMASVGEDSRPPGHLRRSVTDSVGDDSRLSSHLRPSFTDSVVHRVGGSNGSVGADTHVNRWSDQYHDYMDPINVLPTYETTREPSIHCYDEALGFSNSRTEVCHNSETRGFRLEVDVGHEREVEPLSYEGNLQTLALPEEDKGLLEAYGSCQQRLAAAESLASMTPLGRWALRKVAMKEHQSGNHSKSKFFPDLKPSCNVRDSSYEVDMQLATMIQQYANEDIEQSAADQWKMEQNAICGDGQRNIDQGVTLGVHQRNIAQVSIDQGVTGGMDQWNIPQGVTSGEDQCYIHRGVHSGGDQWNNDQGATSYGEQLWRMDYGEDQWNAEHINNLNSDSLLPDSQLPVSIQEHNGKQSKSARVNVKKRLGAPKLSSGSIKTRLGPPTKSPTGVKMRLGPSSNDPNINILGCKAREQYKSRIRKMDDLSGSFDPLGIGLPRTKKHVATGNIHPQGSALPQVMTDGFSGSINHQGGGLSKVKSDVTGSIHPQGNIVPKMKKDDLNGSTSIHLQGGSVSEIDERAAKKEPPEDSKIKKGDLSGNIHPQGGSVSKAVARAAKKEPPQDSKEFKQLVDDAFIKFINILFENPTQRRKFMEGKGGQCCVCPSNSKEFVETASLAKHAFMSLKVGLKAEHLGFHKALCVLLGWEIAAVSKNMWVQRNLPDAETLALKEDLVIWPPVVVIHNGSIANKNSEDEGLMVNVEFLEALLTGIGFVGRKTNMYCGKPGDGSIMVVKFQPTFSGLQEAEKLHKLFADNEHGKAEWRHISSVGLSNSSNAKKDSEAEEANCLYGYLGNAEDWDEVDLGTKKHFQLKSRKQIKAVANASL